MSKGYTRRPSSVDREAFDAAYERTFQSRESEPEVQIGTQHVDGIGEVPIYVNPSYGIKSVPDGCEIADVMTQGFRDQRSRA